MPKDEQPQTFHFILLLAAVKMRVKFPCRMAVEQNGHAVTQEVQPNQEGRFVFNQEIRLREESEKMYAELNICLVTEKGARYTSGMIKLYHSELIRAEGERLVVTLTKCLDPEALCELKVEKVVREGGERKRTLTTIPERNLRANARNNDQVHSGLLEFKSPQKAELPMVSNQTKSEAHFPVSSNMRFRKEESDTRTKQYLGMLGSPNGKLRGNSPKNKAKPANSKSKYLSFQFNGELERDKQIEAQVYKNNYQQLKHKYIRETENSKNELSRRMMLENNENNFKIEIVRLKLRNQELQKTIAEKNAKLKEYAASISTLQSIQSQLNFMREDNSNKDHSLQIMEETIIALSKQNDELRTANKDIAYKLQEKIIMLENEMDAADARSLARVQDLERELKMANETLQFKEGEVNRKGEMLEKEKKSVHQLERALQNKLFQYDSLLQNERNSCKQKIEDIKHKLDDSAHAISKLTNEKGELQIQLDKLKGSLLKNQYECKLYQQQLSTLRAQLQQLRPFRQKYNEIFKQLRIITQQKVTIERTHEKYMHSKDFAIEEITLECKKEIEFQKRNVKELEERNKTLTSKFVEVDGLHEIARASLEKLKRNHESLSKEYAELKDKEKSLKKSLKQKEEQCDDIRKEVTRLKEKNQAIFESMKTEISKVREQLAKSKIQLQSQAIKNQELLQTNNELSMELARLKMTQQFGQEKYQKLVASAQEKYAQFQRIIKQHEGVIELLEDKIKAQKDNEKDYYSRLQKCDYEINLVVDKNQKIIKETRTVQERNRQLQFSLKSKQAQIGDNLKKIAELESKWTSAQEKCSELKEQLQLSRNQLQKGKKVIQILQRDYQKSKSEVLAYSQRLSDRERQLQQKNQQSRRDKQAIASQQSKASALKKQYDKFKESVTEALNTSFAQILHTFSIDRQDSSRTSTIASIQHSNNGNLMASKRGLADLSNDLVNVISMAGKENKGQISKLTDRNKQLERDIELIRAELERNIQHSKRQIQDKAHYIQQLQEQLRNIKNDKGESQVQYQMQVSEIEEHLKQYETQCNSLLTIKSQLQFSLSGLKMETERIIEEYERKVHNMKNEMLVYEEKLEFQYHSTEIVEKKVHELEVELMNINSVVMLEKESAYKKELKCQELEEERQRLNKEIQGLKRQVKQSQQKYSELQIHYLTVSEIKAKYESMLSQQESKLKEIRSFNSNILKEKEEIIKKELQKNMEIASLENTVIELRHQLQQEETSKNKFKNDYEEIKEASRRLSVQVKELESSITFEKSKYNEIRDKLREKEQGLTEMKEEVASLKKKLEEGGSKYKSIIEELKEENDMITRQVKVITSEKDEAVRALQAQLAKCAQQLQAAREQMGEIEESVFVERENNHSLFESTNKIKYELEQSKKRIQQLQHSYEQLLEENREKDEAMFEMGGKIYEYQGRMRELEEEKQREIEEINHSLNVKYDEDYQEVYQKIEFIEKEREYFREKHQEKEECIARKNEELRHREIEEAELKRAYEEKVKKLEEEKLAIFTDKNKEIAKVLEENKAQFEAMRLKESEIRKLTHQLEISRTAIQKVQAKIKETQNDKNSQVKAYQSEIQSLRKKELTFKSYKDVIRSNQWNCERQVRKNIQNFIKKILEAGEKESRNQSVIGLIKGLEEGLLSAIGAISAD